MSVQDDKFYDMFRSSMEGFSPEVPASVHQGLRSKMRYQSFFRFSLTSLNIWVILAAVGMGTGIYCVNSSSNEMVSAKTINTLADNSNIENKMTSALTWSTAKEEKEILVRNIELSNLASEIYSVDVDPIYIGGSERIPNNILLEDGVTKNNEKLVNLKSLKMKSATAIKNNNDCISVLENQPKKCMSFNTIASTSFLDGSLNNYKTYQPQTEGLYNKINNRDNGNIYLIVKSPKN